MIPAENSLSEILKFAWVGRVYIISGIIVGLLLAVFLFYGLTPKYEARMIIAPPDRNSEDRSLTILNENPASSRLMSVPNNVSGDYTRFQQTFREPTAARILTRYQGILEKINKDKIFRFNENMDLRTGEELSNYTKHYVTIVPVGASTSEVLTYRHPDPVFAVKFLQHLHKVSDELIRNEAREQTENRIAYLQKALHEVQNPDHRKALTDQLMLEERQMMVISMDEPFAADIVEPASASFMPVWPMASILFPACLLVGAFLGFLIFSLRANAR